MIDHALLGLEVLDNLAVALLRELTEPMTILVRIGGLALLSGLVASGVAMVYRWYARALIPEKLAILIGVSAIALWLNTLRTLSQYIGPLDEPFNMTIAVINIGAIVAGAGAAIVGSRIGDRMAQGSLAFVGDRSLNGELSPLVQAVGRVITVRLPDHIEDIDGYDPVDEELKRTLAGQTLVFPRGLTVTELRKRIVERLRDEHDVGHVDIDLSEDATVDYLAIGSRVSGLGPTLAPGYVATAVVADPPHHSTPGDTIQLWRTGEKPERVATGELRGTAGDVVTVALDEGDAALVDHRVAYRMLTLSADSRPDREFAALLRAADETMGVLDVTAGSTLEGTEVGELGVTVVAVRNADGSIDDVPSRHRTLSAGDAVYAIARPELLRRLDPDGDREFSTTD